MCMILIAWSYRRQGLVRCYYKCYMPGCGAKKMVTPVYYSILLVMRFQHIRDPQVHRNEENLDVILSVTYDGAHNHRLRPDEELESAKA